MRRLARWIALVSIPFVAAAAAAQTQLDSAVATSSYDEIYDPYDFAEDSSEDATEAAGGFLFVSSLTCVSTCVLPPNTQGEAEAAAQTRYGENYADVYSQSYDITDLHTYEDSATALSQWRDELVFTTDVPDLIGTVRARFRVSGSWDNDGGFEFVGYFYDPATELSNCGDAGPPCYSLVATTSVNNGVTSEPGYPGVNVDVPFNYFMATRPFTPFPDFGADDGDVDVTLEVEFPLILDVPIRFGGMLLAWANGAQYAQVNSLDATVESLHVPPGVDVDSAANALAAYHLAPEPEAALGGATALLGLLGLGWYRRR